MRRFLLMAALAAVAIFVSVNISVNMSDTYNGGIWLAVGNGTHYVYNYPAPPGFNVKPLQYGVNYTGLEPIVFYSGKIILYVYFQADDTHPLYLMRYGDPSQIMIHGAYSNGTIKVGTLVGATEVVTMVQSPMSPWPGVKLYAVGNNVLRIEAENPNGDIENALKFTASIGNVVIRFP